MHFRILIIMMRVPNWLFTYLTLLSGYGYSQVTLVFMLCVIALKRLTICILLSIGIRFVGLIKDIHVKAYTT